MNKKEILNYLKKLGLDKNEYIVISGASLVLHDVIDATKDIDLSCSKKYYDKIKWPTKMGHMGKEIKYNDIYEISDNLYDNKNIDIINGYKVMNLESCLELKRIDKNFNEIDKNKFLILFKNFNIRIKGNYGVEDEIYSLNNISDKKYEFQKIDDWTGQSTLEKYWDYLVSYDINNLENKKCSLIEFLHLLDLEDAVLEERKIKMVIGTEEKNLENVKPCVYCGKTPKLITKFFDDLSVSKEISCQSENAECVILNYVKVHNDHINEAINQWNEKNSEKI